LVLIGIIFRKKLRGFLLKFKFGKGKSKPMIMGGPRFPPTSSQRIYPGAIPRRIIQPIQRRIPVKRPAEEKGDFDEVLKKLKEIGRGESSPAKTPAKLKEISPAEKKDVYVRSHTRRVSTSKK
jgi:hypothetical protein